MPPANSPTPGLDATKEYRTPAPNSQPQANVPVSGEQRLEQRAAEGHWVGSVWDGGGDCATPAYMSDQLKNAAMVVRGVWAYVGLCAYVFS